MFPYNVGRGERERERVGGAREREEGGEREREGIGKEGERERGGERD